MSSASFRVALALVTSFALIGCGADAGERVTLGFVGDILLDSAPGKSIARAEDPFAPTAALLEGADLSIGNLECPVATSGAAVSKIYTFRAAPSTLPLLRQHFDAVSVANNHSGDYGPEALRETLDQLAAARMPYFGGGRNLSEAHLPLLLEKRGLKIALLGYDEYHPRSFEAAPDHPGVAWAEDEQIVLDIARARRAGANIVLPFLHWGWGKRARAQRSTARARSRADRCGRRCRHRLTSTRYAGRGDVPRQTDRLQFG